MSPVKGDVDFVPNLGRKLSSNDYEVVYIPRTKNIHGHISSGINNKIDCSYIDHKPDTSLDRLLKKYDIQNKRSFIFPQMVYEGHYPENNNILKYNKNNIDYSKYEDNLKTSLSYLDNLFESGRGGVPIQNQGAEMFRRAMHRVAEYNGYQSIWVAFSPLSGYSRLRNSEYTEWNNLNDIKSSESSGQECQRAKEYLRSIKRSKPQIGNTKDSIHDNIQRKISRVINEGVAIVPNIYHWLSSNIKRRFKNKALKSFYLSKKKSTGILENNKCIFYPLQWFRESRVTVRSPAFYDQSWIIEYLSRSLPTDYELIIKPHPNHVTAQTLGDGIKISEYAKVVSPSISAHTIIENSDVVVTLNNTVGYEAILHSTPVITLGDAFYNEYPHTLKFNDVNELHTVLTEATGYKNIPEEDVLCFVNKIFEGSSPGEWGLCEAENIDNLTNSITNKLK